MSKAEIQQLYQSIYGRTGEAEGVDYWEKSGFEGPELRRAMINAGKEYGLTYDVEGQTYQNPVAEIEKGYQDILRRKSGPIGMDYWLKSGLRGSELREAMIDAGQEYASVYEVDGVDGVDGKSYLNPTVPNEYGFDEKAYNAAYQKYLDSASTEAGLLTAGPGEFEESPGYQFRLGEGQKALERGAAARGNLLGGATAKALTRYGQDYATSDYDNFLRRYYDSLKPWQSLAGIGQTSATAAAGQAGTFGANVGQTLLSGGSAAAQNAIAAGNAIATGATSTGQALGTGAMGVGQALAGGQINQANALTGALGGGINNYLMWKYMQQ